MDLTETKLCKKCDGEMVDAGDGARCVDCNIGERQLEDSEIAENMKDYWKHQRCGAER